MPAPPRPPAGPSPAPTPAVAEGVFRADTVTDLPAVLRGLGLDSDAAIAAAGLPPRLFDDPLNEVPMAGLGRVVARAVAASGCEHLGLLVGERCQPASLGPVGLLARHSPDVGTALRNLTTHLHLRDRGAVAPLLVADGSAMLGYEIYQTGVEGCDQICDGAMAIVMNLMKSLRGAAWRPSRVLFAHSRPADLRPFRRVFGAPLYFDAERTGLVFASSCLEQPVRGADPARYRELEQAVAAAESALEGDLVAELRRLLRVILLGGKGSVGEVAGRLSMHRRTLNRRLRARGTTLHRLVEETRFEIARQLVEHTRMPLTDVAAALRYADASAFTRAFQRWTGRPPSAWRQAARTVAVANCQADAGTTRAPD
jgi:AraC-like DNA-binding protein